MPVIKKYAITKADLRAAFMQARLHLGLGNGPFVTAARREFEEVRNNRDHAAATARELQVELARQSPDLDDDSVRADACNLAALGEAANALACLQCNGVTRTTRNVNGSIYTGGSWFEEDDAALEAARESIQKRMNEILAHYGAAVARILGDPRGHTVYIQFADRASNRNRASGYWGVG